MRVMRRARVRNLRDTGLVQTGRVEVGPNDTRDNVERHQDYGFAANAVEGEGLRLEFGGTTIILRMDRTAERPRLAPYEVSVWHKEGHSVTLRQGRLVEVECDRLVVKASEKVVFDTPMIEGRGDAKFDGTVTGLTDVVFGEKSGLEHRHGEIERGTDVSGPPE